MPGKKHKVKGKTLNLNDFLGTDQDAPSGYAVVNTRRINWADTMENEAVDEKFTIDYKKDEKIILPTAPKAARGPDVDLSRVPSRPPYTVYLGNLPYDVCDEDVIKFFRNLTVSSVRLPRESGDKGRMRGFGYAEFPDRSTLLEALSYNNENLKNRSIKVSLAEEHDNEGRDRGGREMGRSDRALGGDWRSMPKDEGDDDRRESSFGGPPRSYDDDGGYRRSNFGRDSDRPFDSSRDRPRGFGDRDQDRGFERRSGTGSSYERPRDYDRGGYGGRREFGSSYSSEGRGFRDGGGSYRDGGGSYRDDRYGGDDRDDRSNADSAPRERKKLQLKPRSVPVDEKKPEVAAAAPQAPQQSAPKASAAIFGGARPVDTAAREREIEARLARQREEEERKLGRDREPFQERRDDRVRRSSVGSGSGRSRRSSESGGRDSYDEGAREGARQPLSRQYSNESDQHSQSSRHGPERAISPRALSPSGEQRDLARRPADRSRPLDAGSAPRDAHPTRNGGDRPPSKQEFTAGRDDSAKEVVYTSRNIYAHLQQEDGDEVSD